MNAKATNPSSRNRPVVRCEKCRHWKRIGDGTSKLSSKGTCNALVKELVFVVSDGDGAPVAVLTDAHWSCAFGQRSEALAQVPPDGLLQLQHVGAGLQLRTGVLELLALGAQSRNVVLVNHMAVTVQPYVSAFHVAKLQEPRAKKPRARQDPNGKF